jgi:hypothetical protein
MAFKMKGFSGFGNSPMKVDLTKKEGSGPRAKIKKLSKEEREKLEEENRIEHNVEAKMDHFRGIFHPEYLNILR